MQQDCRDRGEKGQRTAFSLHFVIFDCIGVISCFILSTLYFISSVQRRVNELD